MARLPREVLVVVRRGGEVLLLHRSPEQDAYWHVVAGGVEEGETDEEAALRELAEEPHRRDRFPVGTATVEISCFAVDAPPGLEPRLNEEHDTYRWSSVAEARALMRWADAAEAVALLTGDYP